MTAFDFDAPGGTLEDALGRQADTSGMTIQNQYAKKRRQTIGQQAKLGRLRSGVSNYQFGDLAAEEAGDLAGVESALGGALGQIPIDDYATQQDNARKRQLAELLAQLSKQSPLEEALGALGTAGNIAGSFAAFG
jgi:hypothetical protein